jgi:hypothetical protein
MTNSLSPEDNKKTAILNLIKDIIGSKTESYQHIANTINNLLSDETGLDILEKGIKKEDLQDIKEKDLREINMETIDLKVTQNHIENLNNFLQACLAVASETANRLRLPSLQPLVGNKIIQVSDIASLKPLLLEKLKDAFVRFINTFRGENKINRKEYKTKNKHYQSIKRIGSFSQFITKQKKAPQNSKTVG